MISAWERKPKMIATSSALNFSVRLATLPLSGADECMVKRHPVLAERSSDWSPPIEVGLLLSEDMVITASMHERKRCHKLNHER